LSALDPSKSGLMNKHIVKHKSEATQGSLRHRKSFEQNHTKIPSSRPSRDDRHCPVPAREKSAPIFMPQGEWPPRTEMPQNDYAHRLLWTQRSSLEARVEDGKTGGKPSSGSLSRRHSLWEHHGLSNLQGHPQNVSNPWPKSDTAAKRPTVSSADSMPGGPRRAHCPENIPAGEAGEICGNPSNRENLQESPRCSLAPIFFNWTRTMEPTCLGGMPFLPPILTNAAGDARSGIPKALACCQDP
jgi:hypothetical protein